jgi:hypothetical protein
MGVCALRRDDPDLQKKRIESVAATVIPGCRIAFDQTPFSWLRFSVEDHAGRKLAGPSVDYHLSEVADWTDQQLGEVLIGIVNPVTPAVN